MADEVKNGLSAYIASKWDRNTVADGSWLQKYTLNPLTARDYYLASAIDELYNNTGDKSSELSAAISSVSSIHDKNINYLSATISGDISGHINYVSGCVNTLSGDLKPSVDKLLQKIDDETGRAEAVENKINTRLNNMEAATDVINVYGSWDDFSSNSGDLFTVSGITDNDIIKILNDKNSYPNEMFPDAQTIESGHQTYFRWINSAIPASAHIKPLDPSSGYWDFIGYVDPYYTTTEIDEYLDQINGDFDSLSSTVANNYLSANENAVSAGKNILIDYDEKNPKIIIKTKENVDFNNVNVKNISATNVTALTAQGNSAKYIELSASSISSDSAIINTISANSAHFDDIDISAIDLDNIIAKNISATSSLSGKDLTISNSAKIVGISSTNISSTNISANSAILSTTSGISAKFDNISGKNVTVDYITAINVNASNNLSGKNLTIDEYAKISDISSTNINALSLTTNTASGQSANFDNIFGNNVSYTNISGDKLTVNTSAKIVGISATNVTSTNITANSLSGNNTKFTDISATNITGVYLSSTDISAKNISGLDNITAKSGYFTDISATNNISAESANIVNVSIDTLSASNIYSNISSFFKDVSAKNLTAEFGRIPSINADDIIAESSISSTNIYAYSGYFNYLRGETLQGVTSSIDVDELISAVSSITGESNIYVRKDELECEIGSANTAIKQAFAQGKSNSANENSFAQGNSNTAGVGSFAQGDSNSANNKAFAQGYSNTAYYESFAHGQINRVSNYSMGQGQGNSATNCSIAQGIHNNASNSAQAFGSNLIIESAMAIGKFNKTSSDAVFVIGNGTSDNARNDLMVVDNSAAITLINYPYNDNQVDKIIISTTGVSGMYDHSHGGIELTGTYSSEWSNFCNIENKYVPLSAIKCDIGSNNSASDDELVFMQGMNNYASNNSLSQGSNNSAINDSLAQGYRNLASSNSIAVGMNNSAYANSQSFGQDAYASAGGIAINPHYWGSTSPTKAINNSFAMGKECVATSDSLAFGQNNTASDWSMAFGQNNTASNFSVAFGLGISANNNQYIYGKYPSIGSNTVFAIGNGSADNDRSNYVSINKYGTLNLKNTVNNANKSVIINGHDRYIRSEENCRNIPFLLTSGYALTSTITGSLVSTPEINTETLLLYGNDSDYLNMWVPTGTSGNKFKIMKVASSGTYKISIGIQAGYDMIFKNFSSGTTLASRKKIQTDNTGTSWPTPQQGKNISTSSKSFYFSAEANTTCVQFTEIPGHDDIDVIVDSLGKHFIMIKNHSEV